jgi:hypothetical protein
MRRRHVKTVPVLAAGLLVAFAAGALALAGAAYAELTTDSADCQGQVVIKGDDDTDTTITQDTKKATVDPAGSYSGTGSIYGGKGKKKRSFEGAVKIDLPDPLPDYGPDSWAWSSDNGRTYATKEPKTGDYDLPSFVPRGFYVPLVATHAEEGKTVCVYEGEIKVAGTFIDSPVSLAAAAGTVLFGALATMAGVPRKGGI